MGAADRSASRSRPAWCSTRAACAIVAAAHRSPAGRTDARRSASSTTARRSCSRATPCRAPDSTSSARGADVYVQTVLRDDLVQHGADAALPRHDRLPLDGRAGRADRGARRRRHARAHASDPHARPPAPPTSGSRSRASTSTARSCSAKTSRRSRPEPPIAASLSRGSS